MKDTRNLVDRQMTYWEMIFAKKQQLVTKMKQEFLINRKKKRNANRDVNKGLELAITQRVNKDKILEQNIAFAVKNKGWQNLEALV